MTTHPTGVPRRRRLARRPWQVVAMAAAAFLVAGTVLITNLPSAHAAGALLSQNKPASSSSVEATGGGVDAGNAVDGNTATRWSSAYSDPQWLEIDLGDVATINQVVLQWENYATAFQIQVSNDEMTWTSIYSTTAGTGGTQTLSVSGTGRYIRMYGTKRVNGYGYSLWEFQVFGSVPPPGGPGYVLANPQVTGVVPSTYNPPHAYFHEFQANCTTNHELPDDPIVYPAMPGMSHMHTFLGNTTTNANTTTASLQAGTTTCLAPGDLSGYWMPTLYNGTQIVEPVGPQVIYYKTGVNDYTSVRPFPTGLRYIVGSPMATAAQFRANPGWVAGFECGDNYNNVDFPTSCPAGSQLDVRFQSPSCWNGLFLDTPDHKSHMAYPINGVCPADHPVAVPMIEFKMAFPISGDLSQLHFSSGRGYSFHYDFFNAWDVPTLTALVNHCIVGGLQCDARGYDQSQPGKGAVLNQQYELP